MYNMPQGRWDLDSSFHICGHPPVPGTCPHNVGCISVEVCTVTYISSVYTSVTGKVCIISLCAVSR